MRFLLASFLFALAVSGCSTTSDRDVPGGPPDYAPPPAQGDRLERDAALALIQGSREPEEAIRRLDRRRFAFELDAPTLDWFKQQGVAAEVLDYLAKRRSVDWDDTRGDVDPDTPGRRG